LVLKFQAPASMLVVMAPVEASMTKTGVAKSSAV